jgi:hypothetical protein
MYATKLQPPTLQFMLLVTSTLMPYVLYNNNVAVTDYIDHWFSFGLQQIITKPTRISQHSATLFDHRITNAQSSKFESIIITSKHSDHFPVIQFF